jgi:hypothetical protein
MDFLQKRIREKLIQRGNSERQRAEEWERSLKPTIYLGKNLYQELGGTPIEGRYLGQVGMIPGQSVPNIGRNPNKPVIPGLPQIVIPEPEEGGVIQQIIPAYSAIFTREVAGGRTQWTDFEMMQRDPDNTFDAVDTWVFTDLLGSINSILNDRIFYYWNNNSVQELFLHQSSDLVSNGNYSYDGIEPAPDQAQLITIYTFTPNNLQSGTAKTDGNINNYGSSALFVMIEDSQGQQPYSVARIIDALGDIVKSGSNYVDRTVNGTTLTVSGVAYTQTDIDTHPFPWHLQVLYTNKIVGFVPGSADYEVYKVYTHGAYFTATQEGTSFAHFTNGEQGDGKTRIRYFTGTGLQPSTLTLTELNQEQSEEYWSGVNSFPDYDWRSPWITTLSDEVLNTSQRVFYGMVDGAIQYPSMSASGVEGYFYAEDSATPGSFIKYVFNGEGTASTFSFTSIAIGTLLNAETGNINLEFGDEVEIDWPRIDLSLFGTEGVNWYIEDICTPDIWTSNRVAFYDYWLPMIAIYPYHKKIFF